MLLAPASGRAQLRVEVDQRGECWAAECVLDRDVALLRHSTRRVEVGAWRLGTMDPIRGEIDRATGAQAVEPTQASMQYSLTESWDGMRKGIATMELARNTIRKEDSKRQE